MINKFYVYIYLDPRKPGVYSYQDVNLEYEPFYVGKGTGNRMYIHIGVTEGKCTLKNAKINSLLSQNINPIVVKFKDNLTNNEALEEEIRLISIIGRWDLGKGPLTNMTDGGEGGFTGLRNKKAENKCNLQGFMLRYGDSEGTKKYQEYIEKLKLRPTAKGVKRPDIAERNKSPEMRSKVKAARAKQKPPVPRGSKLSEDHKRKLKEARARRSSKEGAQ